MSEGCSRDETIDVALLDALLRAGGPVTFDALAGATGRTVDQVRAELDALARAGCVIQTPPTQQVTLNEAGPGVWRDYLTWIRQGGRGAADRSIPVVEVYRELASTQDAARRLVESSGGAGHGAIVVADHQTVGRGRLGRRWLAPPGACVTFSVACVTPVGSDAPSVDRLALASAVAVARAVEAVAGPGAPSAQIKWPNDVMVDGRKIAGILIETAPADEPRHGGAAVIGVGVNVGLSPDDLPVDDPALRARVTSFAMIGRPTHRLCVLAEAVKHLDAVLAEDDATPLLAEWRSRCTLLSQQASFQCDGRAFHGRVVDLDAHDGLILQTDAGPIVHLPAETTTVV